jgi:hypothetical protein
VKPTQKEIICPCREWTAILSGHPPHEDDTDAATSRQWAIARADEGGCTNLALLVTAELEVLAPANALLLPCLALGALHTQGDLLGGLGLRIIRSSGEHTRVTPMKMVCVDPPNHNHNQEQEQRRGSG